MDVYLSSVLPLHCSPDPQTAAGLSFIAQYVENTYVHVGSGLFKDLLELLINIFHAGRGNSCCLSCLACSFKMWCSNPATVHIKAASVWFLGYPVLSKDEDVHSSRFWDAFLPESSR